VNLDFLAPAASTAVARSPMEASAADEGARFELRSGWNVAAGYGSDPEAERRTAARVAGWADVSHLSKLELQGPAEELAELAGASLELGTATRAQDAWWCPLTQTRALVIGEQVPGAALRERLTASPPNRGATGTSLIDVTTTFAALTIVGPQAAEVFARFSALDLRPSSTPVGALRPGSIARQPAVLIREAPQRYLFLFGWATAEYVWSVVADAGHHLGARPIGADALASLAEAEITESSRA
jgi:heterotetrameric sarcosine oxidase gamma subunit